MSTAAQSRVRLAELVALLSLGTDLGFGQPMEHVIRECLIALWLAERLGLSEPERVVVYYSGLLAWVGCHTDAYEQAKWLGDERAAKGETFFHDFGRTASAMTWMFKHFGGAGRPLFERALTGVAFLSEGRRDLASIPENHYLATDEMAARLGLGEDVRASLMQSYERWDGKGALGARGEEV